MSEPSSRCALLTPPGRGAIAVIAVFGEAAAEVVEPLFESASRRSLRSAATNAILYGHWRATGEDVILTRYADRVEIHCHGGQAAPTAILLSLETAGVPQIDPIGAAQHLFRRSWQSEIASALARATTERTAEILLTQFNRSPSLIRQLGQHLAKPNSVHLKSVLDSIKESLSFAEFGRHLTNPWSVVLCGPPNVGKSSLINALVGFDRAIVHHEAGTTRDVVTQLSAIDGWPVEFKDTAGLRDAENPIEREGVRISQLEIKLADLVVAVFDATAINPVQFDWPFVDTIGASIIVINKIDLASGSLLLKILDSVAASNCAAGQAIRVVATSTTQPLGIPCLIETIASKLVPAIPPTDLLIPVTQWQLASFRELAGFLESGQPKQARDLVDRWHRED
jgi:tRNA modification GTPase